ncbi:hypothetical protein NP493_294g01035 [Ridgeia piscesae]|uniref:ABC transporter domain-containing protein n=1 Tax=Ridgeia piscesae TaxID=27915 RepID=A0AAD9NWP2_RIDPI|nr:hypothetical protein NP493_294g01035 [Ridgeia piscesae]
MEISLIKARNRFIGILVFSTFGEHFIIFVVVIATVLIGNGPLTPATIFPVMVLLNTLSLAVVRKMPVAVRNIGELFTTTRRLQAEGVPTLENINFEVRPRELLAVIGPVGSGKSSLLMALLGELPLREGSTVKLEGKVAYTSQESWIFSASVRQNILFGQPFDKERYETAIRAAALTNDLKMMPDGDQTLVGERGVSVSGGQKARISLARAVYFNADIYLLDDPLSAVDASVGRHLFNQCICGTLRDKPRILVTHQLQYLKAADRILVLKQGHVYGMGSYVELVKSGVDISSLLHQVESSNTSHVSVIKTHSMPPGGNTVAPVEVVEMIGKTASVGDEVDIPTIVRSCSIDESTSDIPGQVSRSLDRNYLNQFPVESELRKSLLSRSVDIKEAFSQQTPATRGHHLLVPRPFSQSFSLGENRQSMSLESLGAIDDSVDGDLDQVAPLQEEEGVVTGTVPAKVYLKYFQSGTGVAGVIFFVLVNIVAQTSYVFSDWWLSIW